MERNILNACVFKRTVLPYNICLIFALIETKDKCLNMYLNFSLPDVQYFCTSLKVLCLVSNSENLVLTLEMKANLFCAWLKQPISIKYANFAVIGSSTNTI